MEQYNETSGPTFYKFPKTVHLKGSAVVDDDEVLSPSDLQRSFSHLAKTSSSPLRLVIQEKIDGANVSVHFDEEWQPIMQKRSGILANSEKPQYDVFRTWCYENMEMLWKILRNEYCLFGEWLWCQHNVGYDSLPSYFIAFDILEKKTNKFVSSLRLAEMLNGQIPIVPLLYDGKELLQNNSLDAALNGMIIKSKFGSEVAEGLYLRFEDNDYVLERCKFRRKTFVSGRGDFDTKIINNSLKSS